MQLERACKQLRGELVAAVQQLHAERKRRQNHEVHMAEVVMEADARLMRYKIAAYLLGMSLALVVLAWCLEFARGR